MTKSNQYVFKLSSCLFCCQSSITNGLIYLIALSVSIVAFGKLSDFGQLNDQLNVLFARKS